MRQPFVIAMLIALAGSTAPSALSAQMDHSAHTAASPALTAALAAPGRSAENKARDQYRHPAETLSFFGVTPNQTVVEMIPGAGWYTEVLAPYLSAGGKLYVAANPGAGTDRLKAKLAADPVYSKVSVVGLMTMPTDIPANSVDTVLTFRNMHNLIMGGKGDEAKVMAAAMAVLKPGGTLGIVDHRLPESQDSAREKSSGYLKVSTVRRAAEAAGFEFVGASEVNANAKDKADYPGGVWTLPPTLRDVPEADKAKYRAIGESDRMTLKFRKPMK